MVSGAEFQDIEVHLRRQKSGFGFRVLGGDEAGQPVSLETREKARMAMGVEPCHFLLSNLLHQPLTFDPGRVPRLPFFHLSPNILH